MLNAFRAGAVILSLGIAGCAIHPLPEDVTGVDTHGIVTRIRCEAREAVIDTMVEYLAQSPHEHNRRMGELIKNRAIPLQKVTDRDFVGRGRVIVREFEDTAIAYNFTFDMTEMNNFDPTVNLIRPFNNGTGTAALGGTFDRSRENIRTFTVTDTFLQLFHIPESYCADATIRYRNYVYPVVGKIGVGEMIGTFVKLALFDNLAPDASKGAPSAGSPPTMGDQFLFTTTISASATPKVVLTPIGTTLQLADASFVASASRQDKHQVTVGLALHPRDSRVNYPVGWLVDARGNPAAQAAAHTIEQMITRFQLGRNGVVPVPGP